MHLRFCPTMSVCLLLVSLIDSFAVSFLVHLIFLSCSPSRTVLSLWQVINLWLKHFASASRS